MKENVTVHAHTVTVPVPGTGGPARQRPLQRPGQIGEEGEHGVHLNVSHERGTWPCFGIEMGPLRTLKQQHF